MKTNQNNNSYKEIEEQIVQYSEHIDIPEELDFVVKRAIKEGKAAPKQKHFNFNKWSKKVAAVASIAVASFVGMTNLSPTFAKSMSDVPILGALIKVISFTQFNYHKETSDATIETPIIEGLQDKTLEEVINNRYLEENKKLFEQFKAEVTDLESSGESAHLGIDSGFEIKTNNDQILSIGRYVVNTAASSSTTITYDTLDKQNEIIITLPSLFKDNSYIEVISENIKTQMLERIAADPTQYYWVEGAPNTDDDSFSIDTFKCIDANQAFYISDAGKLIISFNKYDIAPGYMGIQEFEIPTEILQDILVSNYYIK